MLGTIPYRLIGGNRTPSRGYTQGSENNFGYEELPRVINLGRRSLSVVFGELNANHLG